LNSWTRNKVTE